MTTPVTVDIPHQLGRAEARRRLEAGFAKVVDVLPGGGRCHQHWDGDRLVFDVSTMGQTIAGTVEVADASMTIEIELPGVFGLIARGIRDRLGKVGGRLLASK